MAAKPPLLSELEPANRADRWTVSHGSQSVTVAADTAWEAWRIAELRGPDGALLPFGSVRVRPEVKA